MFNKFYQINVVGKWCMDGFIDVSAAKMDALFGAKSSKRP